MKKGKIVFSLKCGNEQADLYVFFFLLSSLVPPLLRRFSPESTARLTGRITHTSAGLNFISIIVAAQTTGTSNADGAATIASGQAKAITATIDGTEYSDSGAVSFTTLPFTAEWTYGSTILTLGYSDNNNTVMKLISVWDVIII